jgi:dipeptidase
MCDTLVALPPATATGAVVFGKNSDRERNEAQGLEMYRGVEHPAGAMLRTTYVAIPQARRTHAVLLSRPFWMWGAEMGVNEHGVVIGNEAVHSIVPANRRRALIGMDLVRLGLERGASAREAAEVIVRLLETHGQGGDCGHLGRFYYHNSFIIADRTEALVLETVGKWWAIQRAPALRSLSNALSIQDDYDEISPALLAEAVSRGWLENGRLRIADRLLDVERDAISHGRGRCARGQALLDARRGRMSPLEMMAILRDHGDVGPGWHPADTVGRTICMHAAEGKRRSQSVASLVSDLTTGRTIHWVTGSSAPCLSVFKPVMFETGLPAQGPFPADKADDSRWWRHERLHRAALRAYPEALAMIAPERETLEASFVARMAEADDVKSAVAACWREADAAEARWHAAMPKAKPAGAFNRSWGRLNGVAGFAS